MTTKFNNKNLINHQYHDLSNNQPEQHQQQDEEEEDSEKESDEAFVSSQESIQDLIKKFTIEDDGQNDDNEIKKISIIPKIKPRNYNKQQQQQIPLYENLPIITDNNIKDDDRNDYRKQLPPKPPLLPTLNQQSTNVRIKRIINEYWIEYFDYQMGRSFYYNINDDTTSWKPPRRTTITVTNFNNDINLIEKQQNIIKNDDDHYYDSDSELILSNSVKNIVKNFNNDDLLITNLRRKPSNYYQKKKFLINKQQQHQQQIQENMQQQEEDLQQIQENLKHQQQYNPLIIVENLFKNNSINKWQECIDPISNNILGYQLNIDNENWFCGKDNDGRIFLQQNYHQQQLSLLKQNNNDKINDEQQQQQQQQPLMMINNNNHYLNNNNNNNNNNNKMKDDTDEDFSDDNLRILNNNNKNLNNNDRNLKAQSIAMISLQQQNANDNSKDGIKVSGKFKHTRPFQEYTGFLPPPKDRLMNDDIILMDYLTCTRIKINGKTKRKNWQTFMVILTKYYLYFYKQHHNNNKMKNFNDNGADFIIALLNSKIDWCTNDESSRKNCFKIKTFDCETLIQNDDRDKSQQWKDNINKCINELIPISNFSIQNDNFNFRRSRSQKNNRPFIKDYQMQGSSTISGYTNFISSFHQSSSVSSSPLLSSTLSSSSSSHQQPIVIIDKRKKIRERLLNFLKKRPPLESLREKGIIKDENIFGCQLDLICLREQTKIPKFVQECVKAIENLDIDADGLYRACGNLSTVQKLRYEINQENYQGLWKEQDVHVLTGLLKMFFREMKEPLFPFDRFENLINLNEINDKNLKLDSMKILINNLPEPNYYTLKFMMEHLIRVTKHCKQNRMHIQNLAIVFGPTLIRKMNDLNNLVVDMMLQVKQSQIIDFLLQEYHSIFLI